MSSILISNTMETLIIENKSEELKIQIRELFKESPNLNNKRCREYYDLEEQIKSTVKNAKLDIPTLDVICNNFHNIASFLLDHYYKIVYQKNINMSTQEQDDFQDKINYNFILTTHILKNFNFDQFFLLLFISKVFMNISNDNLNEIDLCVIDFISAIKDNSNYSQDDYLSILEFCDELSQEKNRFILGNWIRTEKQLILLKSRP